jgi:hypothetical protein
VQRIASYPKVTVTTDGRGVCSHVGSRLLADVAAAARVGEAFDAAVGAGRRRRSVHAPSRVLADLAVMLADGGVTGDLAVLRDQPNLFGPVASTATAWRVLDSVEEPLLDQVKLARAAARERAWWLRGEAGRGVLAVRCAGTVVPGLVIDLDATLVTCHSEKQGSAPTYKHGYGYHPLLAWLDNTGEALAGMLRPGNANANAAADHISVTDEALAQIPDAYRYGTPILVRADGASATKAWLAHLRSLREQRGLQIEFSVGFALTNQLKDTIAVLPETAWTVALDATCEPRPVDESGLPVAQVAELTGLLSGLTGAGWPEVPMPGHRHPAGAACVPGGPAPRPRPSRGPHPHRQTGRAGPVPVPRVHDQRCLVAARVDRRRPDRLDPDHPARRSLGQGRAETAALPTPPHRRPDHPPRPPHPHQDRRRLALGRPARRRVQPPRRHPTTPAGLTSQPDPARPRSRTPGEPDTRPAHQPCPRTEDQQTVAELPRTMIIPGLAKEGG